MTDTENAIDMEKKENMEDKENKDNIKIPALIRRSRLTSLGSLALALVFLLVIPTNDSYSAHLNLFTLSLVLIPLLFSLSIALDKPGLFILPTSVLGTFAVFLAVVSVYMGSAGVFVFCLALLIIAALGAASGFIFRSAKKTDRRARKLRWLGIVVSGVLVMLTSSIFILGCVLYISMANPIGVFFAKIKTEAYVKETNPMLDLTVSDVSYDFKTHDYSSYATNRQDAGAYFNISYRGGAEFSDTYERDVLAGGNTVWKWTQIINDALQPALEEEYKGNLKYFYPYIDNEDQIIKHGQPYDPGVAVPMTADVWLRVSDSSPATLSDEIMKYHRIFLQNGFSFSKYDFDFEVNGHPSVSLTILGPEYVTTDLARLIEEARENRGPSGIYSSDICLYFENYY